MRLTAIILVAVCLLGMPAAANGQEATPQGASATTQGATAEAQTPNGITETAYALTWEKDPRYRGRDPFQTVLTTVGGPAGKAAVRISAPRTPAEEAAFVDSAESLVGEGESALGESDFKTAEERITATREMTTITLKNQDARAKMIEVSKRLATLEGEYNKVRARAALAKALQLAARMQAYFETERYGEVASTHLELENLNNDEGLMNPEVAGTATAVLAKCAELKRRAEIHMDFAKRDLRVDAVSHFPEGRSFAIINGEVYGQGMILEPELALAGVSGNEVTFDYKGERISQGLAEEVAGPGYGKRGKEGITR